MDDIINRRRRREIRQVLYRLKRRYGGLLEYYTIVPGTPNLLTGSKGTETKTVYALRRCVSLEYTLSQRFEYDLSFLAANKNFTYGGIFEVGDRVAVLDSSDFPIGFTPQTDDRCVVQGKSYLLHGYTEMDAKAGWLIHLRHTQATIPGRVIEKTVKHILEIEQEIEYE